jgi:hypothetical protein
MTLHAPLRRLLVLPLLGLAFIGPAAAESRFAAAGQGASAGLDFRIIIPPVIRLLENSHPDELLADEQGRLGGIQTLVVLSNMKRGFCVNLRRQSIEGQSPLAWRLRSVQGAGISVDPAGDGWRLCSTQPGRYTLRLQHEFEAPSAGPAAPRVPAAMPWPVATDLMAI